MGLGVACVALPAQAADPHHRRAIHHANRRARAAAATAAANDALLAGIKRQAGEPRWAHIVIHHTAGETGTRAKIDRLHGRRFDDPLGTQYHFLIGNGRRTPEGAIIPARWRHRVLGVHVVHPERAPLAITVSLIGNLHRRPPSAAQMRATEALIRRLMQVYGIDAAQISSNTRVDGTFTVCPGRHFPFDNLLWRLRHERSVSLADWRAPWPDVPMDGPLPDLDAVARTLPASGRCRRRKPWSPGALETTASLKNPKSRGPWAEARLLERRTARGCTDITRRALAMRTARGWFVRELNGYRVARLRRRGKALQVRDARGVMLTCRVRDGQPACATTRSGRR